MKVSLDFFSVFLVASLVFLVRLAFIRSEGAASSFDRLCVVVVVVLVSFFFLPWCSFVEKHT